MATESKPTHSMSLADFIAANRDDPKAKELDELMAQSVSESLTLEEIREQRLSFVMGMLPHDSTMTREQVREILERHYG